MFQHNGFINADKKYLDTFFSKKWGYEVALWRWFFEITFFPIQKYTRTVYFLLLKCTLQWLLSPSSIFLL